MPKDAIEYRLDSSERPPIEVDDEEYKEFFELQRDNANLRRENRQLNAKIVFVLLDFVLHVVVALVVRWKQNAQALRTITWCMSKAFFCKNLFAKNHVIELDLVGNNLCWLNRQLKVSSNDQQGFPTLDAV